MEILGKIFGNTARVKIMRLFLLNKSKGFTTKDVVKRSRANSAVARKELNLLASIGLIKKRPSAWFYDYSFKYSKPLEELLVGADAPDKEAIATSFKKVGRIKLLLVSGVFIKHKASRVDLLIVGNKLKRSKIEEGVRKLEAEIGAELVYAVFETKEFIYRLNMYDKLVRDILDFPHDVILQAKELSTIALKKA